MITVNKVYDIQTGTGPYTFTWTPSNACVTISQLTGTTIGSLSTTFTADEFCFPFTANLFVRDAEGCVSNTVFEFTSPCTEFTLSNITASPYQNGEYRFNVLATGGLTPYTYEWIYNTELFDATIQEGQLVLRLKRGVPPQNQIPITVNVTTSEGCKKVSTGIFRYFVPFIIEGGATEIVARCNPDGTIRLRFVLSGITEDSMLTLMPNPITSVYTYSRSFKTFFLTLPASLNLSGLQTFTFQFRNQFGEVSNPITVTVILPICRGLDSPDIITIE